MRSNSIPKTLTRKSALFVTCALPALTLALGLSANAQAAPQAVAPYQLTIFAQSVAGSYTQPDSIAVIGERVYVGYGNGIKPDGSDGLSSTIVEYKMDGTVVRTFIVRGHNDGLKADPRTGRLWAMQNEDSNAALTIINPETGAQKDYTFAPTAHGGGYDDIVFHHGKVFLSASNPTGNPNSAPAIVEATLSGSSVIVTPVLAGNTTAIDTSTGATVTLNLQDPDSMIMDAAGDLVLDSQDDAELIIVRHPAMAAQQVFHVALKSATGPEKIDDTVFATATAGVILIADRDAETVYALQKPFFAQAEAFSAANVNKFVGKLDLSAGVIAPIVTNMSSPRGMAFVATPMKGTDGDGHE